RLMTDAEYKSFLSEVDGKLPEWEAALKKIDPAKADTSYAVGEKIVQYRDLALMQVGYAREFVAKQRVKRTVSGELALEGFLRGVFDTMGSVIVIETSAGITLSTLETFAPQISKLLGSISNDVTARVELLEKGTCP
ncbi:MAG: hypothetical protein ACHP78_18445, partial [Terriglobales bacterium]